MSKPSVIDNWLQQVCKNPDPELLNKYPNIYNTCITHSNDNNNKLGEICKSFPAEIIEQNIALKDACAQQYSQPDTDAEIFNSLFETIGIPNIEQYTKEYLYHRYNFYQNVPHHYGNLSHILNKYGENSLAVIKAKYKEYLRADRRRYLREKFRYRIVPSIDKFAKEVEQGYDSPNDITKNGKTSKGKIVGSLVHNIKKNMNESSKRIKKGGSSETINIENTIKKDLDF